MNDRARYTALVSLTVALGGFLMGFDSAVISGVVDPIRDRFELTPGQVGTAVACLTAGATAAMAFAGPLADRFGRKPVLLVTAALFSVSAIWSALAGSYAELVTARIIGGFGVGGALLVAPMYIAEIAPPEKRGQLVSFNQLNIVLGFSAAFFSNYFLEQYFKGRADDVSDIAWRWMLGVEAIPAILYFSFLSIVPRSPRWLAMRGREDEARAVLTRTSGEEGAEAALAEVRAALASDEGHAGPGELLQRRMRLVMTIGLGLGFFQQITGINAVFYYSTTIFSLTGVGRDAALAQAILVGLVNVAFTLIAMRLIDRAGRKPLLLVGTAVMTLALLTNSWAFSSATYELDAESAAMVTTEMEPAGAAAIAKLEGTTYEDQRSFLAALDAAATERGEPAVEAVAAVREELPKIALQINGVLVLIAILAYIAAFAISLGPVMWAMFSEIFPTRVRGVAISAAGFFNSLVSFSVQKLFPVGLASIGPEGVFLVFGVFAGLAFLFSLVIVPETKGRSLEELEAALIRD
ncbi:MAG: sugar porter family MFS transporter [Planctomycetota bacterium]